MEAVFDYYGISPWEIEVAYGYFSSRFQVAQNETEPDDEKFVSVLRISMPAGFGEEFFSWFGFRRWEKTKALFKEMKRRRGSGNALKIEVLFQGSPSVRFVVDAAQGQPFSSAVEKIDFMTELAPYQLAPDRLPPGTGEVTYRFDPETAKWTIVSAEAGGVVYAAKGGSWVAAGA